MCPRCHSTSVRRSRTTTLRDIFMRWMHLRAYRCRDCNRRFYVPKEIDRKMRREREWREKSGVRE